MVGNRFLFCTAWFQSSSSLHSLLCRSPTDAIHLGRPRALACRAPFYCTAKELQKDKTFLFLNYEGFAAAASTSPRPWTAASNPAEFAGSMSNSAGVAVEAIRRRGQRGGRRFEPGHVHQRFQPLEDWSKGQTPSLCPCLCRNPPSTLACFTLTGSLKVLLWEPQESASRARRLASIRMWL